VRARPEALSDLDGGVAGVDIPRRSVRSSSDGTVRDSARFAARPGSGAGATSTLLDLHTNPATPPRAVADARDQNYSWAETATCSALPAPPLEPLRPTQPTRPHPPIYD